MSLIEPHRAANMLERQRCYLSAESAGEVHSQISDHNKRIYSIESLKLLHELQREVTQQNRISYGRRGLLLLGVYQTVIGLYEGLQQIICATNATTSPNGLH